mmetsp:Transcript_6009/g.20484  ORF Transcript_6009/g.20484 Transcript_6009/m.20484 type:complete len:186 (+) Transcript_6009:1733-2290(+)
MGSESSPADDNLKQLNDLTDRVKGHWEWINDAAAPTVARLRELQQTDEDNWLRQKVRSTRVSLEDSYNSAIGSVTAVQDHVSTQLGAVGERLDGIKEQAFALRRRNPPLIVAALTLAAVAPAYGRGIRTMARNGVIAGSAGAFFLYPEFIARTAPYVDKASSSVSKRALRQAEKLGLVKERSSED